LRGGATLWFPTAEQAVEAAQPLADKLQAEAARIAARQRRVGGIAAFVG